MKRIIIITMLLIPPILASSQCHEYWEKQGDSSKAFHWLSDIHAINSDTAIAVGYGGTILRTTDGGNQWQNQDSNTDDWLISTHFINSNKGWVLPRPTVIELPSDEMLTTNNGGIDWNMKTVPDMYFMSSVFFVDAQNGWIAGQRGTIFRTKDRGKNWQKQFDSEIYNLASIYFINQQKGWAVGSDGIIIHKPGRDQDWYHQKSGTGAFLNSVHFIDSNNGWIAGKEGTLLYTKNSGQDWQKQSVPVQEYFKDVYFTDAKHGWVVGDNGTILETTNGGKSWEQLNTSTSHYLKGVHFANAGTGWAVGNDGIILKYESTFPKSSFQYSTNGRQARFTNTSANDSGQVWHFGDGDTSHQARPEHTYDSNGVYEACLVVTNACGKDTACRSIEMNSTGDVHRKKPPENLIALYPNPAKDRLHIELKSSRVSQIHVLNGIGQTIQTINAPQKSLTLNISQWEDGVYIIRALDEEHQGIGSKQLIKH